MQNHEQILHQIHQAQHAQLVEQLPPHARVTKKFVHDPLKGDLPVDNIWANMDYEYNPVTTKKKLREAQRAETMRKIEEENRIRNEEIAETMRSLEEIKQKYLLSTQQTMAQINAAKETTTKDLTAKSAKTTKLAKPVAKNSTKGKTQPKTQPKTTQKKNPNGKK